MSIKEPTEPFSASQRLAEVIQLDTEKIQVDIGKIQSFPEQYERYLAEVFPRRLKTILEESGLVGEVRESVSGSGSNIPTLRIVTRATLDLHVGSRLLKVLLGVVLFPLLPFFDVEDTWILSADVTVVHVNKVQQSVTVTSEMSVTRKALATSVLPIYTLPTVAEDLSWKIARELQRHPDWLRPASAPLTQ